MDILTVIKVISIFEQLERFKRTVSRDIELDEEELNRKGEYSPCDSDFIRGFKQGRIAASELALDRLKYLHYRLNELLEHIETLAKADPLLYKYVRKDLEKIGKASKSPAHKGV